MVSREIKDTLRGVELFVLLWGIMIIIAFWIFNVESNTRTIIQVWILAIIGILYFVRKQINKDVRLGMYISIAALIILYFVPINTNFPDEALQLNQEISDKHEERMDYAEELFYVTEAKGTSPIRQYLLEPWKVFLIKDAMRIWAYDNEYIDSNVQAQMYRNLLIESGRFTEDEVILKQGFCSNSPHGYVKFQTAPNESTNVFYADHWAVDNFPRKGIDEVYKFGQVTLRPCDTLTGEAYGMS